MPSGITVLSGTVLVISIYFTISTAIRLVKLSLHQDGDVICIIKRDYPLVYKYCKLNNLPKTILRRKALGIIQDRLVGIGFRKINDYEFIYKTLREAEVFLVGRP